MLSMARPLSLRYSIFSSFCCGGGGIVLQWLVLVVDWVGEKIVNDIFIFSSRTTTSIKG